MDAEVDAIVNPTDLVLSGGGGLDFVIRQAAGREVVHVRNSRKLWWLSNR